MNASLPDTSAIYVSSKLARFSLYLFTIGWSLAALFRMAKADGLSSGIASGVMLVVLAVLFIAWLAAAAERKSFTWRDTTLVGFLFIAAVVPVLLPPDLGTRVTWPWIVAHAVLLLFVGLHSAFHRRDVTHCLTVLMISSVVSIVFGANAFLVDPRNLFFSGRLTGVLGHPNLTGIAAVLGILLCLSNRRLLSALGVSSIIVLLCSFSITSFVALAVGGVLIYTTNRALRASAALLALTSYFVPLLLVALFARGLNVQLFTGRVAVWEWIASLHFNALFGNGLTLFEDQAARHWIPWVHAHNQLLMDLATGGLILASVTIIIVLALWSRALSAIDPLPLSICAILTVHCFSEVPFFLDSPSGRLVLLVPLVLTILSKADILSDKKPSHSRLALGQVEQKDRVLRNGANRSPVN